jgi:hypothetical protein
VFSVSFFDDEGDEPPTRSARPRRPAHPRGGTGRSRTAGGPPSDQQQLMLRRALALGAGVVVLILLVVGVKGCLDSRAESAMKDYNRDVNTIVTSSNEQVAKPLFEQLSGGSGSNNALVQNVRQIAVTAANDFDRAQALSVPDDMRDAQRHLLLALSLRSEGVEKIARDLREISGTQKRKAVDRIAGSMRTFLASDVLFSQRIDPYITQVLEDNDIQGQEILASQFLPNNTWLSPTVVGNRLGVAGAGAGGSGNASCPSSCGHGLTSVEIGGTTLQPGGVNNRVTLPAVPAFTVTFQNQGERDEFDVTVRVAITAAGTKTITALKRVDETKAGQSATTQIRLTTTPPLNRPVSVKVTVAAVPGEKTTSNNTQTYLVTFSR